MYFCPCCGYRVLYEQPPGTYLVCPICFWEDTEATWELRRAQLNFTNFGVCDLQWLKQVRPPTDQDERDPNWQLLDEKIKADGTQLIQQVITAFKSVKREDGISLHEAHEIYLISDYAYNFSVDDSEAEALLAKAKATDVDTDWQEIPEEILTKFIDSLGIFYYYLDPKGWRYYLPAYIVWSLHQYIERKRMDSLDCVVYDFLLPEKHEVLDRTKRDFNRRPISEYIASITAEQLSAICQFLWFVINYSTDYMQEEAQKAIEQYWKPLCQSRGLKNVGCA